MDENQVKIMPDKGQINKNASPQEALESAYCIVRVRTGAEFSEVYRRLCAMRDVVGCDAVHDDYHLVVLMQADDAARLQTQYDAIKTLEDVEEALYLPVVESRQNENPALGNARTGTVQPHEKGSFVEGYVLVEAEKEHLSKVYLHCSQLEGIVTCALVSGAYQLLLRIKQKNYHRLKKVLTEKIRPMLGLLRARQMVVIDLFRM